MSCFEVFGASKLQRFFVFGQVRFGAIRNLFDVLNLLCGKYVKVLYNVGNWGILE